MYLYKASLITTILYSIYRIFFYRTSFHALNRYLLLFIMFFSLICPVLVINSSIHYQPTNFSLWIDDFQEYLTYDSSDISANAVNNSINFYTILFYAYLVGAFTFLLRFVHQLYKLIRLIHCSNRIREGKFTFVLRDNFNLPFSFFHWIFISAESYVSNKESAIIQHEKVHGYQWHSLDLLLMEIFTIAFWFNPFVFLLKRSLKTTHEYIADQAVILNSVSTQDYLSILVSGTEKACLSGITNHFKYLTIKNRIEMITKNKTYKLKKLGYLIFMPLLAFLIFAFSYNPSTKENVPFLIPIDKTDIVKYSVTHGTTMIDPFTKKERVHYGIDIVADEGTKIIATADGIVTYAKFSEKGWGNLIIIRHDENYETWYAHLKEFSVDPGEKVKAGQAIASVGSTGKSTGPHLHYEVRKDGVRVDPEMYFK